MDPKQWFLVIDCCGIIVVATRQMGYGTWRRGIGLRPLPPTPDHCSLLQDCRFLALLQADLRSFETQICHLAWLVASLWLPGGPWADFGTLASITKDTYFEVQTWIFADFWWILVPMGVIWHAWCLYFTVLGDPGTILGRSWDTREYKKGHCEVQAWILSIFGRFRIPI